MTEKVLTGLVFVALVWVDPSVADERQDLPTGNASTHEDALERPVLRLSLQECIDIALKNNRRRPVSRLSVEISEAQRRQALSLYWPQVVLKSAFTQRDDHPLFIFPEETDVYTIDLMIQEVQAAITMPEKRAKLLDKYLDKIIFLCSPRKTRKTRKRYPLTWTLRPLRLCEEMVV